MYYHVSEGRFADRGVLITGGANGLGFASARRVAAEGAKVGLIDLDADGLQASAEQLSREGYEVRTYTGDVTDVERIEHVVSDFHSVAGSIDAVMTFAGTFPYIEFDEMTFEEWQKIAAVSTGGTFVCARAAMRVMRKQRYGRIVTISSNTVLYGMIQPPVTAAYVASKAGVIGLTRCLAREGGPHGITANCILPGLIATQNILNQEVNVDEFFREVIAEQCVNRRGEPEDIAEAAAFLAAEGSSFISGQSLCVGGGDRFL